MKNLRLKYYIVVNISLCLAGIIFVGAGVFVENVILTAVFGSIGVGLLAAGLVNIFDRAITLEPPPTRIEVAAERRIDIPEEILNRKFKSAKVDIVGISLNHVLEEMAEDDGQAIITRLLAHNLQLRLFMVHPDAPYLKQRAIEDNESLAVIIARQKKGVQICVKFYQQLLKRYDAAKAANTLNPHATGSLQIKLLSFCPYLSIYRIDDEDIYWGIYTSDKPGLNLPLLKTSSSEDSKMYNHLHQHIHGLMERDTVYPDLVSMSNVGKPFLNTDVLSRITFP